MICTSKKVSDCNPIRKDQEQKKIQNLDQYEQLLVIYTESYTYRISVSSV